MLFRTHLREKLAGPLNLIACLMPIFVFLQTTIQRHRMIHAALADEFAQGLHALSLKTKTEEELQKSTSA